MRFVPLILSWPNMRLSFKPVVTLLMVMPHVHSLVQESVMSLSGMSTIWLVPFATCAPPVMARKSPSTVWEISSEYAFCCF